MSNPHGAYIWYELMTADVAAAEKFYTDVVGWTCAPFAGEATDGGMDYRVFSAPDAVVAGLMTLPHPSMRPGWFGYIGVDDVDASVEAIEAAGGSVKLPANDIPGVGRMAMVADPDGIPFYVMRGASEQPSTAFSYTLPGHCSWNEAMVGDLAKALDFYCGRFGWTKGDIMPMGAMGDYQILNDAKERMGAMMKAPPGAPQGWNYYFRVTGIDAAVERITAGGGTVRMGPIEVPGGDWIVPGGRPAGRPLLHRRCEIS